MPISPGMRCSPAREARGGNHKRGCSLESGIVFKERDDDLALFSEVQSKERDNFLLQSNDDFEDIFVTKLRHFSDHKIGINVAARGESSDLLNAVDEKNDYEWLITPPDTPLFPSLDDETPQVNTAQRGRPKAQPISISRSSTMEKSHRSSRGSPSPNRLSPSPRSHEPTFQPRNRATSAPSSSPPPTRRPAIGSRRPSSPSSKPSSPPPRASTPTSRRLSTGSTSTTRGISGNSVSPKVRAWQVNIPGFSTEAPPNLRTSLADRPASYTRGSSPASRNRRKSMSPTASRNISSSHSKGSFASSADDVESLPSITVDGSDRSNSRRVSSYRNNNYNKVPSPQKPSRTVSSSSAPKRSFDMALRQMDHRKSPQNMFRPLLSSVPTSNFYAGKTSPAWNSSVTTSSNASSDLGTSGPHDIEENELNDDEATSGITKVPDSNVDDEVIFMYEKPDSLHEDTGNEIHDISSNGDGFENLVQRDTATSVVLDDFNGQDEMLVCSRCGCEYPVITQTEDEIKLCLNCQKSTSSLAVSDTVTSIVAVANSEAESTMSDKDHELVNPTTMPQLTLVKDESPELTCKGESQSEQHEDLVKNRGEHELTQLNHDVISQPSLSYSDTGGEQIQHTVDFPKSKVDYLEGDDISIMLKRSSSIKGHVTRSGNFSASSISYDALSYMSASSSVDFGPRLQSQLSSRKSDIENYKYDPVNVKHRRSMSSLSGTSSHAFHTSSVGTSTLDSFEVPVVRVERYVADSASVGPQENPSENDTSTENVDSEEVVLPELLNDEEPASFKVSVASVERDVVDSASVGPKENARENNTCTENVDSGLPELLNDEEPASFQKVEGSGKDVNALMTRTVEEGTSLTPGVDITDVTEAQLGALSEGEVDHTCSSSPASQHSTAVSKDMTVSAMDLNTSNHSSSIVEESTVLVEGKGGTKGRSLTLEEATETILFCSSIVHNLAYEAATIAMEKETPPEPSGNNDYWPLVPAVTKGYSGRKYLQNRKTSKRSSKSQKMRKTMEGDTMKAPNSINSGGETDLLKTRILHSNNKENTKPPMLESKCNCRIM
ncbi:hypothetical protein L1987_11271 [Smallanthus sonchifolius]|uniref:Uncharacterized protein n=1 Tax=Smallanthus sonchifolius TaxID=185202 RepID=A0ACB9JAH4_9ASTR|nr:hypothetical protein L1987_11271 [Smallanthus sonchifolius]